MRKVKCLENQQKLYLSLMQKQRKIELEESNPTEAINPLQTMNKRLNLLSRESEPSIWVQMFTGITAAECPGTYIPPLTLADQRTVEEVNELLGSKQENLHIY
jgi:hypothetical protein